MFNTHFTSIASKLNGNCNAPLLGVFSEVASRIESIPYVTPKLCYEYLNVIPNGKSTGPDGISVKMLKNTFPYIVNIVTDMINRMLIEGVFPTQWKLARVTPIFKGGDKNDPSNFRPISVVPILSKLLERHVNIHLQNYLKDNNILHERQSGFREGFSCVDAVHGLVSDCVYSKSKGEVVSLIFLDFKKAFDCVNHSLLLVKLKNIGIFGKLHCFLSSFLCGRSQFVKQCDDASSLLPIDIGVPQGSILAPTMFLVFINDLLKLPLHSLSYAYADDTVFVSHSHSIATLETLCNRDMEMISHWCKFNRMVINTNKSHFLLCNSSQSACSRFSVMFENTALLRQSSTKLLGFHLNDKLLWDDHVAQVSKTLRTNLLLFQKCRPYISRKTALLFYYHFIFCHLTYGIHIYHSLSSAHLTNPLFVLQKRAFRLIAHVQNVPAHLISTRNLSLSLQLLPLPKLAKYFSSLYCFKILREMCPLFILKPFSRSRHRFHIRDSSLLHPPRNSFLVKISTDFNVLPSTLRSAHTFRIFKRETFRFYFDQFMSSV